MSILLDVGALLAAILLGYLFYLVLFERGVFYRPAPLSMVSSDTLAMQLRFAFEQDLSQSSLLDLDAWQRRSWSERILATLGRVIERHQ